MDTAHQHPLREILKQRIAIIDGAMGTTIRTYGMTEPTSARSASQLHAKTSSTTATSSRSPSPA